MVCHPCRRSDHDNCIDNPRRLAFAKGEIKGMTDVNASSWCDCQCLEAITVTLPVKEVVE